MMFPTWQSPDYIRREGGDLFSRSGAIFSRDERLRFLLWRIWDPEVPPWVLLMCNPSTADETANDPTVAGCQKRARSWRAGGLIVVNLFSLRCTDPRGLRYKLEPGTGRPIAETALRPEERIGNPDNDRAILEAAAGAGIVIAGWGAIGGELDGRGAAVSQLLREAGVRLYCFRETAAGHPEHPLYIPHNEPPKEWRGGR